MPTQMLFPQLGESVVEGTVGAWLKAEGSRLEESEPLLEVATDKVNVEIPSPASGTLLRIVVPEGQLVRVGAVLGWIGEPGEQVPEAQRTSPAGRNEPPVPPQPESRPAAGDWPALSGDELFPGSTLPLSPMRWAIAERVARSKRKSPHATTVMDADLTRVVAHREKNTEALAKQGVNLTFTAYVVAAAARALVAHPRVN